MKKILMTTVESKPYATAGGTSDVTSVLTKVLRQKGYDVRLVLPYYSTIITEHRYSIKHAMDLSVPVGGGSISASVHAAKLLIPDPDGEVYPVYLINGDPYQYFAKVDERKVPVYPPLEDQSADAGTLYAFFCRAVLEMTKTFCKEGWKPNIIHCHDWPAGLIPTYLKHILQDDICFQGVKVVFTIHNISDVAYQGGWFGPEVLQYAGIPQRLFDDGQVRHDNRVNFMKAGIVFSDRVNTVSEGYAIEIKSNVRESFVDIDDVRKGYQYSGGLDYVWSQHNVNLIGIRNGIDDSYDPSRIGQGDDWSFVDEDWKPKHNGHSVSERAYSAMDAQFLRKKGDIKRYLQMRCNQRLNIALEETEEIPIIAIRSRLAEQKGFDLIIEALRRWDFGRKAQFIVVAWGEDRYAIRCRQQFEDLMKKYPNQIAFSRSWRDVPELLHYAGADMLLMPSLFEPCGLPHMMALRCGTIPIVRRTGGLADVIRDFDPITATGNGFDFIAPDYREMLRAIERALQVYQSQDLWQKLVRNAIQAKDRDGRDFTWNTSADRYIAEMYS